MATYCPDRGNIGTFVSFILETQHRSNTLMRSINISMLNFSTNSVT